MKPSGAWFLGRIWSGKLGVHIRRSSRRPRGREARPHPHGPLAAPPTYFFLLYIPIYPKNIQEHNRSGVPPLQASVATKNQLGPYSGTLLVGGIIIGGHLHHPGILHDDEGVVHPQGWGYVPVAMCLISLYRVLDLARSWCIASFAIIVGSYDVSPPLLSCNGLSFPLKWSYRIESLRIWEHLMYVLHVLICGDNGIFTWSTWCMFWWSTCGFTLWTYA